jgi:hypothetical protein
MGLKETQKLIAESLTSFLIALKQRVTDTTDSQTAQLAIKLEKIALYLEKRVVRGLKSAQNKTNCPSNTRTIRSIEISKDDDGTGSSMPDWVEVLLPPFLWLKKYPQLFDHLNWAVIFGRTRRILWRQPSHRDQCQQRIDS